MTDSNTARGVRTLLFILVLLLMSSSVYAYTGTGTWMSPTASYDPGSWTNCDSVFASDNNRASNSTTNNKMAGKTFSISLYDSCGIDSVDVRVEGWSSGSTAIRRKITVQLSTDGGVNGVGDVIEDTLSGTTAAAEDIQYQYGSTNRKWNLSLTEAQIESSDFAVIIGDAHSSTGTMKIDNISVRVWYHGTRKYMEFGRGSLCPEAVDVGIRQSTSTTNYGSLLSNYLGTTSADGSCCEILQYWTGLSDSLYGYTVDTAKLTWNATSGGMDNSPHFGFYIMRRNGSKIWVEAQATYNKWSTDSTWTTAGAFSTTGDIYTTAYGLFTGDQIAAGDNVITVTDLFKAMDGNDTTGGGVICRQYSGGDEGQFSMASANNTTVGIRPFLRIWAKSGVEGLLGRNNRRKRIMNYYITRNGNKP